MNTHSEKAELLIPAGDLEKMRYAFAFGADAVYAGVPAFSLRTREIGFRADSLAAAVDEAHQLKKKIYLAMNIYAHDIKIDPFLRELDRVAALQPDALILTDPGLIRESLKRYPELPVHLSTQANTTNWLTVQFWRDLGVRRIILSRELKLEEIRTMHEKVPDIELEAFVHGAICIAYSGRCLISNYMNHRDANQGTCTNSCRWEYTLAREKGSLLEVERSQTLPAEADYSPPDGDFVLREPRRPEEDFPISEDEYGTYLMNSRDLCAIELLPELLTAGIVSLKAEGRTKSTYYAALVSRSYRRALDDHYAGRPFNPDNLRDLMALSSRTYTTGFYSRNPRQYGENFEDGYSASDAHRVTAVLRSYDAGKGLAQVTVKNRMQAGQTLSILTPDNDIPYTVEAIYSLDGNRLSAAHGGAGDVLLPLQEDPGDFAFFRENSCS